MSSTATTETGPLSITVTAHAGPEGRLLLFAAHCRDDAPGGRSALDLSVVIDRSGSMSGDKLSIARQASVELVRSLDSRDHVSVIAYDDEVKVIAPRTRPEEQLAKAIAGIGAGGSTNLYGGWVTGAKMLKPGGRVLLLSDGLANVGKYRDAESLASRAGRSYERYKVSTTTIGVGNDYDEALMAGMARSGGGAHYFARSADAIRDAFSQERFGLGATAVGFVSVRVGKATVQLGQFFSDERKQAVLKVDSLDGDVATVRFTVAGTREFQSSEIAMPRDFGHSDEATLELLIRYALELEAKSVDVRNPASAGALKDEIRSLLLKLLGHKLAESPRASSTRSSLEASMDRLANLQIDYTEEMASLHRKRSMQNFHNVAEPARAYSPFSEDRLMVREQMRSGLLIPNQAVGQIDHDAISLAPLERWREWRVAPIEVKADYVVVVAEDFRNGFLFAEIEREVGRPVRARYLEDSEVQRLFGEASASSGDAVRSNQAP